MTRFAELGVTSNFSFLRGASHPEEMIAQAFAIGLSGLGLADRNTLAGVVRAHQAWQETGAREAGFKLAVGSHLVFTDATPDILVYPATRSGWARLCRLLTTGNRKTNKGQCLLTRDDLLNDLSGLLCIVVPPQRPDQDLQDFLSILAPLAAKSVWLAADMPYNGSDRRRLLRLVGMANAAGVPLLASNTPHFHHPDRRRLADVVTCIREHTSIQAAGCLLHANAERHLKPPEEMARLFHDAPDAVAETMRFMERISFTLDEIRYDYPDEPVPAGTTPQSHLEALTWQFAAERHPDGIPDAVEKALRKELDLIARLDYAPYFLTVYDIVRFARSKDILCQGRGSAANSAVCFMLGITAVDPTEIDLLFERFVSEERREPPDIDVDFEHERREEVIQYQSLRPRTGRHRRHGHQLPSEKCHPRRRQSARPQRGRDRRACQDSVGLLGRWIQRCSDPGDRP